MQQITAVRCGVVADLELPGADVERCPGVQFALNFRVECCRMLVGIHTFTPGEIPFPLSAGLIPPPDLPPVATAVASSRIEPGPAFAVFAAWFVAWSWMGLVPPVVDAHAALPCSCWAWNQAMTSAGS